MFGFIKRIFFGLDRSEKAADRIGETLEGIAEDLQQVRQMLRQRLGLDEPPATPAIEERPTPANVPASTGRNGRKAKAA